MKLFHWNRSDALRNYSSGDIMVVADTVEEARAKVIDAAGPIWGKERGIGNSYFDNIGEFEVDDWREFRSKLLLDLEGDPIVVESGVVFIWGSE